MYGLRVANAASVKCFAAKTACGGVSGQLGLRCRNVRVLKVGLRCRQARANRVEVQECHTGPLIRVEVLEEERVSRGFDRRATRVERVHPASSVSAHTGPVGSNSRQRMLS